MKGYYVYMLTQMREYICSKCRILKGEVRVINDIILFLCVSVFSLQRICLE